MTSSKVWWLCICFHFCPHFIHVPILCKVSLLCACFHFCLHFIHVMLSKGCFCVYFHFCPHFIHVKQGLFTLFVSMLHMSCQARTVYSLCFRFCPHVTHVKHALFTVFPCFCFCPHFILVKQELFTLFVSMLHMSCQARTAYSLCFRFCPHVTHVAPSKDCLLSVCWC